MAAGTKTYMDRLQFVKATGGGKGVYEPLTHGARTRKIFYQQELCEDLSGKNAGDEKNPRGLGFGRISFTSSSNDPKLYLRIPHTSSPKDVLHFVETVWNLPRPKLLVGITGGAGDFPISAELQSVLDDLMQIALDTDAWIFTGGTRGGIMKYFGEKMLVSSGSILDVLLQGKPGFVSAEMFH